MIPFLHPKPSPRDRQGFNVLLPMAPNHFEYMSLSFPQILMSITTLQVKGKGLMRTYFVLGRKISRGRYGKGGSGANNTSLAEVCLFVSESCNFSHCKFLPPNKWGRAWLRFFNIVFPCVPWKLTTRHKFTAFENQVLYGIFLHFFVVVWHWQFFTVSVNRLSMGFFLPGCVRDGASEEKENVQTGTRRTQWEGGASLYCYNPLFSACWNTRWVTNKWEGSTLHITML